MNFLTDKHGVKFRVKELTSKQSDDDSQVGLLKKEFAEHPSSGLTPAKLAEILKAAEHGDLTALADLAEDIEEKDGHIFAELSKRKTALLTVPWKITPPRNATDAEIKDAELINEILADANCIDDIILDMADAILKGYSYLEMQWHRDDNLWLPHSIIQRPQRWFQLNPDDQNEIRLRNQTYEGAELRPFNWIKHEHKVKSGYIGRANLVRVLVWSFLFKNYSVRDLAEFLEIYGLPLRLGKYSTGANDGEKRSLLRALMSIGHNAGGIIPKGMDIEFHNAANGQADPFELMINWCERTASKAILGATLTSQADGKSSTNALGNVHNDVRLELRNSDLRQVASTLTRDLIMPLYLLNGKSYSNNRRLPRFEFDTQEPEDLKLFSEALPPLVEQGMKIPLSWAHEKLQVPLPKDDEEILGTSAVPDGKTGENNDSENKKNAHKKEKTTLKARNILNQITALKAVNPDDNDDAADLFSQQLTRELAPQLNHFVDEVESLVENATSLEQLQEQLAELDLSIDEMGEIMQYAFAAAELAGQQDVSDGN